MSVSDNPTGSETIKPQVAEAATDPDPAQCGRQETLDPSAKQPHAANADQDIKVLPINPGNQNEQEALDGVIKPQSELNFNDKIEGSAVGTNGNASIDNSKTYNYNYHFNSKEFRQNSDSTQLSPKQEEGQIVSLFDDDLKIRPYVMFLLAFLCVVTTTAIVVLWLRPSFVSDAPQLRSEKLLRGTFKNIEGVQYFVHENVVGSTESDLSERVLLPERRKQFDASDPCHVAVLLGELDQRWSTPRKVVRRIIDLYQDSSVCGEDLDTLILRQWGISVDVDRYPSTYLRRADRENSVQESATRTEKSARYRQAERSIQSAIDAYASFQVRDHKVRLRISTRKNVLEQELKGQRYLVNTVAEEPKHELVHIEWGEIEIPTESNGTRVVQVPEFWIDRYEVSNSQFSSLYAGSEWEALAPSSFAATGMTWNEADHYCKQLGMRLVYDIEYIKAALWDSRARLLYRFPWGSDEGPLKDVVERGIGHVQEDPTEGAVSGVLNLVGNVDEWTSVKLPKSSQESYLVIGASGESPRERLLAPLEPVQRSNAARESDTGFRCAVDTTDGIDKNRILYE